MNRLKILTVSKSSELKNRVRRLLGKQEASVLWESSVDRLLSRFESDTFDVLILTSSAYKDGQNESVRLLDLISAKSPATQILFLAETKDMEAAMSALQAGTYHYARLPVGDKELKLLITTAAEDRPQYGTNILLKNDEGENRLGQLIGRSECMRKVYRRIRQAAATEIPVLILGETGTGKDLAAQAIHSDSARSKGSYIPVNLGALPSDLVASELFGHQKGSFTGAIREHYGKFEQANDGTIFLDEIEAIDEKVQISLLRLLEEKKLRRLGGRKVIKNNARLIAASNANLEELVRGGSFREDLFYRLDVFRIIMPSLKEREGDIALLVEEFVGRYKLSFKKDILKISPQFIQILEKYDWPGNVRELKNVVQRAVLVCEDRVLLPKHLPARLQSKQTRQPKIAFKVGTPLVDVEKEMILQALRSSGNNRTQAAKLLGISRRAIYNKIRKHGLD